MFCYVRFFTNNPICTPTGSLLLIAFHMCYNVKKGKEKRKMTKLTPEQIASLETPCIVVDVAKAEENIKKMQAAVSACGCRLRPHIKTHKMAYFARKQMEAGACGVTCAKVSEAEIMADAGIDDIFIAYPMVGVFRVRRALALRNRVKRLILAVDSFAGASALNAAARDMGVTLEVRMEIDTGAKRTGVPEREAVALALGVSALSNLSLTGIYTFKSLVYQDAPTLDAHQAGVEEGRRLCDATAAIRAAGVPIEEISAGSTPTAIEAAQTGQVTEVRPGTYIFNDYMLHKEGICSLDDTAAWYWVTVVSTPERGYAVIDGGSKTFPMDVPLHAPPMHYPGYAAFVGRDDLYLERLKEEHGMVTGSTGSTGLSVGDKAPLYPIHVCPAINLQNEVYLLENGVLRRQRVDARGMLV